MRSNTPSDLASPARHSLAHRKSRRRPSGRFIAFPGEVSSRFHGLFRLPFALPRFARAPAIFTARRRRFFLRARDEIFSQLLTFLSVRPSVLTISLWPIPPSSDSFLFFPSFLPAFLPSFLRCCLPSRRFRYKECPFVIFPLLVEPTFFTMPVALNRINLPARFEKIPSHNSVMKTRPEFPTYNL